MVSPPPSGHCKGLVPLGDFVRHDLACGVSGVRTWVELRQYCSYWLYVTLVHTAGVLYVFIAFDRTRATH